jgi:4-phytase/acid phosphatase
LIERRRSATAARGLIAVAALLIGLAAGGSVFAEAAANPDELVKVVVVSRHGVRAPLNKPEELALWADKDWPDLVKDWQVSRPGLLTPAGKALAKLMGEYYRVLLASENLLPARACPTADSLFVWADVDPRTLDTAASILEGLAGGCRELTVHSLTADVDPLFHPVKARVCAFNRERTEAAVLGRVGGDFGPVQQAFGNTLQTLQGILGCCKPELCKRYGKPESCTLADLGSTLVWKEPADPKKENASFSLGGTLGIASTAAEVFLLEYASGFKGEKWGFGRVDEARMLQTSRLHTLLFETVDRTPYVAKREGSELLNQVARTLLEEPGFRLPKCRGTRRPSSSSATTRTSRTSRRC